MENEDGTPAANGNSHANGHVEPPWPIYYRALGGGMRVRYSRSHWYPRCSCRLTFAYLNHLVLALDDERRQLVNLKRDLKEEMDKLRQMVSAQGERITEFEDVLASEVATTEVTREELQRARPRLFSLGEEVRDWASGILTNTGRLVDEVIDIIHSPDQEKDPKEEIPPGSPTVD